MRRLASTAVIAALLAAGPAHAFDPTGVDIIGLHLGMRESDAAAQLANQGFAATRVPGAIAANTKDGRVEVAVSAEHGVTQITYIFNDHMVGARSKIHEAIMMRFGTPDQATPLTWCRAVGHDGICPARQPTLKFLPASLTLRLSGETERQE